MRPRQPEPPSPCTTRGGPTSRRDGRRSSGRSPRRRICRRAFGGSPSASGRNSRSEACARPARAVASWARERRDRDQPGHVSRRLRPRRGQALRAYCRPRGARRRDRPGHHRAARLERRGQDDVPLADPRTAVAGRGRPDWCSAGILPPPASRCARTSGTRPSTTTFPRSCAAADFVRHLAEVHLLPRRAAVQRANDALWLVGLGEERFRSVGRNVDRAAPARQARRGDRARSGARPARRADRRPRPRAADGDARPHPPGRHRVRDAHRHLVAPPRGGGADLRRGRHRRGRRRRPLGDARRPPPRPGGLLVEVDERAEELAALLRERGHDGRRSRTACSSSAGATATHDAVRDAVADLGIGLRRLAPRGRTLEDVYLGDGDVSTEQGARLFGLGYRALRGRAAGAALGDRSRSPSSPRGGCSGSAGRPATRCCRRSRSRSPTSRRSSRSASPCCSRTCRSTT